MPTPWLPSSTANQAALAAHEGALSRLEKFMDDSDGVTSGSLKAKPGAHGSHQQISPNAEGQSPTPLVQQYPVEAGRSSSASPENGEGAAGSEFAASGDHESESDMEIQTVFLGGDGSKPQDKMDKAPLGHGLPKSSIQDDRQHLHSRTGASQEETSTANFGGNGGAFSATAWVSQVVSPESSSFASQNLKYMKALNDPYVKALAAHRRELNASRIDLEREYVDTMASKLSTQRSGALATLNVRSGEGKGRPDNAGAVPAEGNGRCQCYGLDNSICENNGSLREAEHEKVVMVPYYAVAGQVPLEDTSRSAASSAGRRPSTRLSSSSEDIPPIDGHHAGSSWSLPWLSSMSSKIPALPDILSVVVGAEPLNSARRHKEDPQRQIPLSELIDGMETQL